LRSEQKRVIPARGLGIVDKEERKLIIDVAVPSDSNIKDKKQREYKITRSENRAAKNVECYHRSSPFGSRNTRCNIPSDRETRIQHPRKP
jgi:hypothetical protein